MLCARFYLLVRDRFSCDVLKDHRSVSFSLFGYQSLQPLHQFDFTYKLNVKSGMISFCDVDIDSLLEAPQPQKFGKFGVPGGHKTWLCGEQNHVQI